MLVYVVFNVAGGLDVFSSHINDSNVVNIRCLRLNALKTDVDKVGGIVSVILVSIVDEVAHIICHVADIFVFDIFWMWFRALVRLKTSTGGSDPVYFIFCIFTMSCNPDVFLTLPVLVVFLLLLLFMRPPLLRRLSALLLLTLLTLM